MPTETNSLLEFALLGTLRFAPQSGYQLRKAFTSTPMRHMSDSPGSIYPALRRLAARGWIRTQGDPAGGRRAQLYALTPKGKAEFLNWLRRPIGGDDASFHMDTLLLRFAFMGGVVPNREIVGFLDEVRAGALAYAKTLERFRKFNMEGSPLTGKLGLLHGIETYRTFARWAAKASAVLKKEKLP